MASTGAPAASDWDWGALDCEVWSGAGFGCCLDLSLKRKIWLMMISAKVTANTINMRRSPPGSCCGFLYSAKFKFRSRVRIPQRIIRRSVPWFHARWGHGIESRAREGMPPQQPRGSQQASANHAVALDSLDRILRAGGNEAAGMWQHGRDHSLVAPQYELHRLPHFCSPVRARCAASRKARVTSLTNSAKGTLLTLFRGLNTTSMGPSQASTESRTASRIRRLMRLRWTAPPKTLPTVNPTRGVLPAPVACGPLPRRRKNTVMFPVNCRRPLWYTR